MKEWSESEDHTLSGELLIAKTAQTRPHIDVLHHHKMHLITLIFGIVLLPKAYALKCYECTSALGSCTGTEKECSSMNQCAAVKLISYAGDSKVAEVDMKTCALAKDCIKASVNFGISKTLITTKCCNSDLCNTQLAPAPSKSSPNGKKCFTCDGQSCTATLNCDGDEDYCISTTVKAQGQKMTLKGCASKQVCSSTVNAQIQGAVGAEVSCCQGDLCNSASSTNAGLLLLMAPLVSLVIFA